MGVEEDVRDVVEVGVGVRVALGVVEGVFDGVGVTVGVLDAVAPNDRDAVGVCVGVGV